MFPAEQMLRAIHPAQPTIARTSPPEVLHCPAFQMPGDEFQPLRNCPLCTFRVKIRDCLRTSFTYPCTGAHRHNGEAQGRLLGRGHASLSSLERSVYNEQMRDDVAYAIDLSMRVFLHVPSGPVSAMSCVILPDPRVRSRKKADKSETLTSALI